MQMRCILRPSSAMLSSKLHALHGFKAYHVFSYYSMSRLFKNEIRFESKVLRGLLLRHTRTYQEKSIETHRSSSVTPDFVKLNLRAKLALNF